MTEYIKETNSLEYEHSETNKMPQRKRNRLENYDYSSHGAYFITICIKDRKRILSDITKTSVGVGDRIFSEN